MKTRRRKTSKILKTNPVSKKKSKRRMNLIVKRDHLFQVKIYSTKSLKSRQERSETSLVFLRR